MTHFRSFKITAWASLAAILLFWHSAEAQRYQLQFQIGANSSEASIQDNGQSLRETFTFYDPIGNAQFGLAFHARLQKNFYLRLDGNFRAYRIFFKTQTGRSPGGRSVMGNLISEKFNTSLLPEYRFGVSTHPYVFAGPVLSLERKKNYSQSFLIENGSQTTVGEIKPDAQAGWSVGAGVNPPPVPLFRVACGNALHPLSLPQRRSDRGKNRLQAFHRSVRAHGKCGEIALCRLVVGHADNADF